MQSPQAVYDAVSAASGECSKLQSPEDELGEWTQNTAAPPVVGASSSPLPKDLTESKWKASRRTLGCMVFFFASLPSAYLAVIIGLALYEPTIHAWFKKYYLTVYIAFGATLVLFFVHIFPRVKAHPILNIVFSSLFLTAMAYLAAALSVIFNSASMFIVNLIGFAGGWQLMVCSLFGVDFESIEGRVTCVLIYLADYILIAIFLPAKISDKVIAIIVSVIVARTQIVKVNAFIDTLIADQDAV